MTPVTLPHLAVARVHGADAGTFLQAQLSADIATLADGGAVFACYCSPRGQVLGLLLVCRAGEAFRLIADRGLLPGILQRLNLFVLRARVVLESEADVTVAGRLASQSEPQAGTEFQPAGHDLLYQFVSGDTELNEDWPRWKQEELRRNIVWLGPETSERFIPQMLGFDRIGAVSFGKGCYPGQEVIARARYLGKVKRKPLLLWVFEGQPPIAGEPLKLLDEQQWLDGTAVDSVELQSGAEGSGIMVFAVTSVPVGPVKSVDYSGNTYRCATI